jgi:hypothetical protein
MRKLPIVSSSLLELSARIILFMTELIKGRNCDIECPFLQYRDNVVDGGLAWMFQQSKYSILNWKPLHSLTQQQQHSAK